MHIVRQSLQRAGALGFCLLGKHYSTPLILIGTVALAGGAAVALPSQSAKIHQHSAHTALVRGCQSQPYVGMVYITTATSSFVCM